MFELKQPRFLPAEIIAQYLGCSPGLVRVTLRRLAKGGYDVEVSPGQWVRVISVKVEPSTESRLKPGEGLVEAADSATSVAELKRLLLAAIPAGRIQ
jgi:biotin operon repressor